MISIEELKTLIKNIYVSSMSMEGYLLDNKIDKNIYINVKEIEESIEKIKDILEKNTS